MSKHCHILYEHLSAGSIYMSSTATYNMTIYLLVLYICPGTVTYNMTIYLLVLYICPGTVTYNMTIYLLVLYIYICPKTVTYNMTIYMHYIYVQALSHILSKKVLHKWVLGQILSWSGIVAFYFIYHCSQKSFCNNLMYSNLKSNVP